MDDNLFDLAQAWLEHCREQAEYFDLEGEDDTAEKWLYDANEAERIIKNHIDTPVTKIKAHGVEIEVMLSDWDGSTLDAVLTTAEYLAQHPDADIHSPDILEQVKAWQIAEEDIDYTPDWHGEFS